MDYSVTLIVSLMSSAGFWAIVQWFVSRKHREAERTAAEAQTWFNEADRAYKRVSAECDDCQKKVRKVQRELDEVKEALIDRLNAFDEILPYVTGLPQDKIHELRRANHAVKIAAYRTFA